MFIWMPLVLSTHRIHFPLLNSFIFWYQWIFKFVCDWIPLAADIQQHIHLCDLSLLFYPSVSLSHLSLLVRFSLYSLSLCISLSLSHHTHVVRFFLFILYRSILSVSPSVSLSSHTACPLLSLYFFSLSLSLSLDFYFSVLWRLSSQILISKPKLLPRATSEIFVDLSHTGNSFIDPSNSFHMLDEINNVDDEGYVSAYLTQDRIEGRFQQRSCLNDERWLGFTTLLTDTATIARPYWIYRPRVLSATIWSATFQPTGAMLATQHRVVATIKWKLQRKPNARLCQAIHNLFVYLFGFRRSDQSLD